MPCRREHVPQFFVGDFNIKKDSEEYVFLMKATGMSESAIDDPRPYSSDFKNSWKKPSDGAGNKLALIDHVLLDPRETKTAVRVQHIQRATHEFNGKTIDLADHYGVSSEVVLTN
jgi:endonuclease/exonuclease/phosphatase family metal-dependent hydrolase